MLGIVLITSPSIFFCCSYAWCPSKNMNMVLLLCLSPNSFLKFTFPMNSTIYLHKPQSQITQTAQPKVDTLICFHKPQTSSTKSHCYRGATTPHSTDHSKAGLGLASAWIGEVASSHQDYLRFLLTLPQIPQEQRHTCNKNK